MYMVKVSSFCFTYFHLKHTSHSLSPLCADPLKTLPLLETATFSSRLKRRNSCLKIFSAPKKLSSAWKSGLYQYSAVGDHWSYCSIQCHGTTCKNHKMLLIFIFQPSPAVLNASQSKIPIKKEKNPNISCMSSNHSIGHKAIYNYSTML